MPTGRDAPEPGPAEFDRIVSRLRAEDPGVADVRRVPAPRAVPASRQKPGDGPFALACLAVIVPMSMVVGGWFGLAAMLISFVVASWLIVNEAVNPPR